MRKLTTCLVALCATAALWASNFTPAAFSIASGKQVYFSQGNLQYTQSTETWSFAENQYDMIGAANVSGGALASKIDLFGWSMNNTTAPWGISTSTTAADYAGDFVDWGTNTIGTAASNTYRTLTNSEWEYLLKLRTNSTNLRGLAHINLNSDGTEYANGLIFLPDNWTAPEGITFAGGSTTYTANTFTLDQWQQLEAKGAVFLPASGSRKGTTISNIQVIGYYWSATVTDDKDSYFLKFSSTDLYVSAWGVVYNGYAVRLAQDLYAVTVTTPENGTVTADKTTAAAGETVTLSITPATDYKLDVLSVKDADNNTITVSTDNKFTMPASAVTVTATFKKIDYAITIASEIANGKVSVTSGAATANYGDEVELTITPATGYELDVLSVKDAAENTITVENNKFTMPASAVTVTATFKKIDYAITIADDIENGKVTAAATANYGDEVELTITPATGYKLDVLTVKDAEEHDITVSDNKFTMPASAVTVTATFKKIDYAITIANDIENGKVTAAATANYGDEVELTITPDKGYKLEGITVKDADNQEIPVSVDYKFEMPASAVTVTATFKKINYAITIADDIENGAVTAAATANYGDEVELTVTPATGYKLDVLTVKDAANQEIPVSADNKFEMPASAVTVTATFKKIDYAITIASEIENGEVTAVATANYGDEVELTITPATGYKLDVLTVKDAANQEIPVSADNKFEMPASAVTVTATFKKIDYAITIASEIENGEVTAVATANYGDEVELTITPATGYKLDVLTVKDAANQEIPVSADNKFEMPASAVTVTATFKKVDYAITIDSNIENGEVTAAATANYGDEVELTITPATGYELDVLSVKDADNNDVTVTEDNKFTMPASAVTVTATFKIITPTALQNAEMVEIYAAAGRIYGVDGMQIFTLTGQNVTRLNGQLNGVYIVKVGDKAQKVVVSRK